MNRYHWHYEPSDSLLLDKLTDQLGIHSALGEALLGRGIDTYEKARTFFCPSLKELHNPFAMLGMDVAVERIFHAIERNERILIFGDYDVDGTTSVAMLLLFLKEKMNCADDNLSYYIPDRINEGYGLQQRGVSHIINERPDVLITVDCGISSVRHIQEITAQGIDCIICDHHLPSKQLPPALAILNPKQPACLYPYKELCACGVVFKLLQALAEKKKMNVFQDVYSYLDFVALATAADIVPLTGENRILVHVGVARLNKRLRPSIVQLQENAKVQQFSVEDIVFKMAPRINAAGRIHHARDAVSLLLEANKEAIVSLTQVLEEHNEGRKNIQQKMVKEAFSSIEQQMVTKRFSVVLADTNWSKGVLGIVASKIVDEYYLPTIVGRIEEGKCIASARSIEGIHIVEILNECSNYLEQYGGHQYAAGLTIKKDCFAPFAEAFESAVKLKMKDKKLVRTLTISGQLRLTDINIKLVNTIERMQPFGPNNHNPIWLLKSATLAQPPIPIKEKYLKMIFEKEGKQHSSILFDSALEYLPYLQPGQRYDIAYKLKKDYWFGKPSISFIVQDIQKV